MACILCLWPSICALDIGPMFVVVDTVQPRFLCVCETAKP